MKNTPSPNEDPLLQRVRRSLARARMLGPRSDKRRALVMMAEIREHIRQMQERLDGLEDEIKVSTRTIVAGA